MTTSPLARRRKTGELTLDRSPQRRVIDSPGEPSITYFGETAIPAIGGEPELEQRLRSGGGGVLAVAPSKQESETALDAGPPWSAPQGATPQAYLGRVAGVNIGTEAAKGGQVGNGRAILRDGGGFGEGRVFCVRRDAPISARLSGNLAAKTHPHSYA